MHLYKILILMAIGLLFTNARVLKKKIRKRITSPRGCIMSAPESTYGCFGTCNCQSIFLDEMPNYCGCQFVDTYGVLSPELSNVGRMPAIRLPKTPALPICASCDPGMAVSNIGIPVGGYEVLPAINLPGLCEPMPCLNELPCSCQLPMAVQYVETPCGCKIQCPIVELPSPILTTPVQSPICLPQVVRLPSCSCQNMPCSCQSMQCGCQTMPCGCQIMPRGCQAMPCECINMPCSCQNTPCGCPTIPCECQNVPCICKNIPCSCQNTPCACQNCNCNCQNVLQYGFQLPALELPCACQACQLSPVELPVCSFGCQSLPPPVIGCAGKYLRQVTIQPPFL